MRFIAIILLLTACIIGTDAKSAPISPLFITLSDGQNIRFEVEVASSSDDLAKGLMFRKKMPTNNGMLFDFGENRQVTMWMKNTLIPLDILFITMDGTIVSMAERTVPLSLESIHSRHSVRYVLEINAGATSKFGIKVGDKISHSRIR